MKKIYLFISIILAVCNLSSQETRLIDSSKIWSMVYDYSYQGIENRYTYSLCFKEDTLIGEYVYKKTYYCEDSILQNWQLFESFIREDSGKVFRLDLDEDLEIETLVYDFDLNVGDTFSNSDYILLSIDSIELNGNTVAKFEWKSASDFRRETTWIEGIGCLRGFYNDDMANYIIPTYFDQEVLRTSCVKQGVELIYYNPPCYEKSYSNMIDNLNMHDIKLQPTLVLNDFQIITEFEAYNIKVYDINGIIQIEENLSGNSYVDCVKLYSGFYFVKVTSKKDQYVFKIIKSQ